MQKCYKLILCVIVMSLTLRLAGCAHKEENIYDKVSNYIKEKNYPMAIHTIRQGKEFEDRDDLLEELYYMVQAPNLACSYTYVAAINDKNEVSSVIGDYGFEVDPTEWKRVYKLIPEEMGFSVVKEDGIIETMRYESLLNQIDSYTKNSFINVIQSSYMNDYFGLMKNGSVSYVSNSFSKKELDAIDHWSDVIDIAAGSHLYALTKDGKVISSEPDSVVVTEISSWTDIIAISAYLDTIVGLKRDGTVVCASEQMYGSNDVSAWSDIVAVKTCAYYTLGMKSDGTLVTTEYKNDGLDLNEVSKFKNLFVPLVKLELENKK